MNKGLFQFAMPARMLDVHCAYVFLKAFDTATRPCRWRLLKEACNYTNNDKYNLLFSKYFLLLQIST